MEEYLRICKLEKYEGLFKFIFISYSAPAELKFGGEHLRPRFAPGVIHIGLLRSSVMPVSGCVKEITLIP